MPPPLPSLSHPFANSLWPGGKTGSRSREMSPLYIERFRGPRTVLVPTAHPFWELTCVLAGEGAMRCEQPFLLNPGTVCLLPPGLEHSESSSEVLDTIWMGVEGSFLPAGGKGPQVMNDAGLAAAMEKLWLLAQERGEPVGPELDGMTKMILGRFFRLIAGAGIRQEGDLVSRAMLYFDRHYSEPLSMAAMARSLGCSEGHISRSFRRRAGVSPMTYLRNIRLRQAALLLQNTKLPVTEIAALTGYNDPFYLSRAFRQAFGKPPSAFRLAGGSPENNAGGGLRSLAIEGARIAG